ncbi:DUF418 domain-containing protein [Cellulomonas carbonis]|uniref:DUF418 domain-containing protein n=1 Tax=Cellulomonas carbonis T26 TaxID=947969 RepID=A0A0A0BN33_9CELL|nr:DUF418 domain-containing protein [Cellulomonas carbonis]KGM09366.1 hypothetical protein N868_02395 [Cellulomonas carbonis T26]GGC16153.1 hypothetical protein GCM10010972_31800 [Cellulomonas carbonis]
MPLHPAHAPPRRLLGIDAARGIALLGMIVVNVGPVEGEGALHRLYLLPYGRASVLFVVIAGIGMGFMLRSRRGERRRWPTVAWRAGLLLVGGLALQLVTDDVSVILPVYGVLFLLALVLQRAPTSLLLGLALTMTLVGPVLYVGHVVLEGGEHLTEPLELGDPVGTVLHGLVLSGRYPLVTWCVPFLVGLWLARLDLRDADVLRRMMLWGGLLAVAGFALSQVSRSALGREADVGLGRLLTGAAHGQMPLWLVSSVAGAVFVVGLMVVVAPRVPRLAAPLADAGGLALTLYVLHVLVLAAVKPPDGFTLAQGMAVSLALSVSFLVAAVGWRRLVGTGPLEVLLRASWFRPPPTRAAAPAAVAHPLTDPGGAPTHET